MIYYIIGYPVSGKSTFARKVGDFYNIDVYDLDSVISSKYNKSINELFIEYKEDGFRKIEKDTLKEITESNHPKDIIISTGGGCSCNIENINYMKRHGVIVYLETSPYTILQRLKNNRKEIEARPRFLAAEAEGNLYEFIMEDYESREYFYKTAADIIIANEDLNNKWPKSESIG